MYKFQKQLGIGIVSIQVNICLQDLNNFEWHPKMPDTKIQIMAAKETWKTASLTFLLALWSAETLMTQFKILI